MAGTLLSLPEALVTSVLGGVRSRAAVLRARTVGPCSVLYGGPHLFSANAPAKLERLAEAALERFHGDAVTFARTVGLADETQSELLLARTRASLRVASMCIDFEDGYGVRSNEEEDGHAESAGRALAEVDRAENAPIVGLRIKALSGPTAARGVRTLDRFVTALAKERGGIPSGFTVTLPKVERVDEVRALAWLLTGLENALGIEPRAIGIELMIETPRALTDDDGRCPLGALVEAADGRCTAAHLGAYDLTAAAGVAAGDQSLAHPICSWARVTMQMALAGSGVAVVDGATTTLPVGADADAVRSAWRLHASNVRHALAMGIDRGWDLHPAQLVARWGAIHAHFLGEREAMIARSKAFREREERATRVGQAFDDAATGHGLVAFFARGLAAGALSEEDVARAGLDTAELRRTPAGS